MITRVITLLTDFGTRDGFVGTMKGVIYTIAPDVKIVDISHEVEPQDIDSAAFLLFNSYRYFPAETIHVVVVDPGVGSERKILCVRAGKHYFLAPDNGVLKYIFSRHQDAIVREVTNQECFLPVISQTFHGRDIFAPVAAFLAKGIAFEEVGDLARDYNRGHIPELLEKEDKITGRIIYIDRFGNLITNIPEEKLQPLDTKQVKIKCKDRQIVGLSKSYAEKEPDQLLALVGSSGFLELSVNLNNAQKILNASIGDEVIVIFK